MNRAIPLPRRKDNGKMLPYHRLAFWAWDDHVCRYVLHTCRVKRPHADRRRLTRCVRAAQQSKSPRTLLRSDRCFLSDERLEATTAIDFLNRLRSVRQSRHRVKALPRAYRGANRTPSCSLAARRVCTSACANHDAKHLFSCSHRRSSSIIHCRRLRAAHWKSITNEDRSRRQRTLSSLYMAAASYFWNNRAFKCKFAKTLL